MKKNDVSMENYQNASPRGITIRKYVYENNKNKLIEEKIHSNIVTGNLLLSLKNKNTQLKVQKENLILPYIPPSTSYKNGKEMNKSLSPLKPVQNIKKIPPSPIQVKRTIKYGSVSPEKKQIIIKRDTEKSNSEISRLKGINRENADFNQKNCASPPERSTLSKTTNRENILKSTQNIGSLLQSVNKISNNESKSKERMKYFSYIVMPENNGEVVKRCFKHRINWKEAQSQVTTIFNFKWQELSLGIDYANLNKNGNIKQIVNHYEYHSYISNKLNLFLNMTKYCEERNIEVFKYLPLTIIFHFDNINNFNTQFNSFTSLFNNIKEYIGDPAHSGKRYNPTFSLNVSKCIKSNLFINNVERIGMKTSLYIPKEHYDGKNMWLVKAVDLNRGRCIRIGNSIEEINKLIKKFYSGIYKDVKDIVKEDMKINPKVDPKKTVKAQENNLKNSLNNLNGLNFENAFKRETKKESSIEKKKEQREERKKAFEDMAKKYHSSVILVQKYIEKPLLYYGRKFDIRMWVLVNHKMDVYLFKEGHIKTSSYDYNLNETNAYVHLTNYSVQKYAENFGKYEVGNEVSFDEFQQFIRRNYPHKRFDVRKDLLEKMAEIITLSMKSVEDKLNESKRRYSFEIFGYDFILDSNFNLYLLEVNTNPGLEDSSPLISMLVQRMIDDALRLTIDQMFDTCYQWEDNSSKLSDKTYKSPFHLDRFTDSENIFQYICSLGEEIKKK